MLDTDVLRGVGNASAFKTEWSRKLHTSAGFLHLPGAFTRLTTPATT